MLQLRKTFMTMTTVAAAVWTMMGFSMLPVFASKLLLPNHANIGEPVSAQSPFAALQLANGPNQVAHDLQLDQLLERRHTKLRSRRHLAETTISGTCIFYNAFTSSTSCAEFRGDDWSSTAMQSACSQLTGTVTESSTPCVIPSGFAGYCIVTQSGSIAASPLAGDCTSIRNLCESTVLQGTFQAASACGGTISLGDVNAETETDDEDALTSTTTLPASDTTSGGMSIPLEGYAMTLTDQMMIYSCYNSMRKSVQLIFDFPNVSMSDGAALPWLAIGYRENAECRMLFQNGADADFILVTGNAMTGATASFGKVSLTSLMLNAAGITDLYKSLVPLASVDGFSNVMIYTAAANAAQQLSPSSLRLAFEQQMDQAPDPMYLLSATGSSSILEYRPSRLCFNVTEFPACQSDLTLISADDDDGGEGDGFKPTGAFPDFEGNATTAREDVSSSKSAAIGMLWHMCMGLVLLLAAASFVL